MMMHVERVWLPPPLETPLLAYFRLCPGPDPEWELRRLEKSNGKPFSDEEIAAANELIDAL